MPAGTRRLLAAASPPRSRGVQAGLANAQRLALAPPPREPLRVGEAGLDARIGEGTPSSSSRRVPAAIAARWAPGVSSTRTPAVSPSSTSAG